jgi:hypothetical protein
VAAGLVDVFDIDWEEAAPRRCACGLPTDQFGVHREPCQVHPEPRQVWRHEGRDRVIEAVAEYHETGQRRVFFVDGVVDRSRACAYAPDGHLDVEELLAGWRCVGLELPDGRRMLVGEDWEDWEWLPWRGRLLSVEVVGGEPAFRKQYTDGAEGFVSFAYILRAPERARRLQGSCIAPGLDRLKPPPVCVRSPYKGTDWQIAPFVLEHEPERFRSDCEELSQQPAHAFLMSPCGAPLDPATAHGMLTPQADFYKAGRELVSGFTSYTHAGIEYVLPLGSQENARWPALEPPRPPDWAGLRDKNGIMESIGRDLDRRIEEKREAAHQARTRKDSYVEHRLRELVREDRARGIETTINPYPPAPPVVARRLSRFDAQALNARLLEAPSVEARREAIRRAFPDPGLDQAEHLPASPPSIATILPADVTNANVADWYELAGKAMGDAMVALMESPWDSDRAPGSALRKRAEEACTKAGLELVPDGDRFRVRPAGAGAGAVRAITPGGFARAFFKANP